MFAHALTNKLLHAPSVQLRQAGFEGRLEILQFAKQLFAIPELESEIL
jgi:glutamyl-tRNA reductase